MREVGYTGPELITKGIAKKIQPYSGGLLRRINIIADKVLLAAFAESTHNLTVRHVMAAVNDSGFKPEKGNKNNGWLITALVLTVALVLGQHQFKTEWLALLLGPPMGQMKKTIEIATLITDLRQKLTNTIPLFETPITTESKVVASKIENSLTAVVASSPTEQIVLAVKADSEEKTSSVTAPNVAVIEQTVFKKMIEKPQESDFNQILGAGGGLVNERLAEDYNQWLSNKIKISREWLTKADKDNVSIQVMMRRKTAARELVLFLKNDWPLDLENTYLYEVQLASQTIYRVFYREFDSMTEGYRVIKQLPESVRLNGPYLQSIYQMQSALLN
jgi:hypothetical protein